MIAHFSIHYLEQIEWLILKFWSIKNCAFSIFINTKNNIFSHKFNILYIVYILFLFCFDFYNILNFVGWSCVKLGLISVFLIFSVFFKMCVIHLQVFVNGLSSMLKLSSFLNDGIPSKIGCFVSRFYGEIACVQWHVMLAQSIRTDYLKKNLLSS